MLALLVAAGAVYLHARNTLPARLERLMIASSCPGVLKTALRRSGDQWTPPSGWTSAGWSGDYLVHAQSVEEYECASTSDNFDNGEVFIATYASGQALRTSLQSSVDAGRDAVCYAGRRALIYDFPGVTPQPYFQQWCASFGMSIHHPGEQATGLEGQRNLTQATYRGTWPFRGSAGVLECQPTGIVTYSRGRVKNAGSDPVVVPFGPVYGLTAAALAEGYRPSTEIVRRDPRTHRPVSLAAVVRLGLGLCARAPR